MEKVVKLPTEESLNRLQQRFPQVAHQVKNFLESHKLSPSALIKYDSSSFNWIKSQEDGIFELYHEKNIPASLRYWASKLNLEKQNVVLLYGLGLGYPREALKDWLQSDPSRRLVVLEDDPEAIIAFLNTDEVENFLNDQQVNLVFVPKNLADDETFFQKLALKYLYLQVALTALPSYEKSKLREWLLIQESYNYCVYYLMVGSGEYIEGGKYFYKNFWVNIHKMPGSHAFTSLKDTFKGIPAIIVGAGPSLSKNIHLLKNLSDKALIISGGTSVNILNGAGINPHLILGLDPYDSQFQRALAYTSFEVPYVFNNRLHALALKITTAPQVYLDAGDTYMTDLKLEEELGIHRLEVDIGTNVVHAGLKIAEYLGCDPIITIGVDLAYSNNLSYGPKLRQHALHSLMFKTKDQQEDFVERNDIFGNPVKTLWKWIHESAWTSQFQKEHPHVRLINATEGGIGFSGIPNRPLNEVSEEFSSTYDIEGLLHASLQKDTVFKGITSERIQHYETEMLESLKRISQGISELTHNNPSLLTEIDPSYFDEATTAGLENLKKERAWQTLLLAFDIFYINYLLGLEKYERKIHPVFIHLNGYLNFLKKITDENINVISFYENSPRDKSGSQESEHASLTTNYEGEQSQFFDSENRLLASTSMKKGKKEGRAYYWYQTGQIYADLNFKNNLLDGLQTYYYLNGQVRTQIHYTNGLLDGDVIQYWSNGNQKRLSQFKMNSREGYDKLFDENGQLVIEAFYKDDKSEQINSTIEREEHMEEKNFTEKVSESTEDLTHTFEEIVNSLEDTYQTIKNQERLTEDKTLETDMDLLKKEMIKLKKLGDELSVLGKFGEQDTDSNTNKSVQRELSDITDKMKTLHQQMDFQVKDIAENIKNKPPKKES